MEQPATGPPIADRMLDQTGEPPASKAPAPRRRFAVCYLRVRRLLRRVYLNVQGLYRLGLRLAPIVILVFLGRELARHQIEIQPIAVPKSLAEEGYSPEVAARHLKDAINQLVAEAMTFGGTALKISMPVDTPDIVVPTVGVSMTALTSYLQQLVGYSPRTTVAGELIQSGQSLNLLLRLDGQVIFRSREPVAVDHIDDLWRQAATAIMLEISPYRVALAEYVRDPVAAVHLANKIAHRYPDTDEYAGWAHVLRGARLQNLFMFKEAEDEFRGALEQPGAAAGWRLRPFAARPSYAEPAQFYLGVSMLQQYHFAAAKTELEEALQIDRTDPAAHHYLGIAFQGLGRMREAAAEFAQTRKIYSGVFAGFGDPEAHGAVSVTTHVSFGNALLEEDQKNIEDALEQFDFAVSIDSQNAVAHRNYCYALRQAKRLEDARQQCSLAAKLAPECVENQILLAQVLIDLGDFDDAQRAGSAALYLAPRSALVYAALGYMYGAEAERDKADPSRVAGDRDQAVAEYQRAIELAPQNPDYINEAANLLYDQAAYGEAVRAYRQALALGDHPVFHSNLARALAAEQDNDGAIGEYQQAIKLYSRNPEDAKTLGDLLYGQARYAEAERAFRKAIALDPHNAAAWNKLGLALRRLNPVDPKAVDAYRMAKMLAPKEPALYCNLAVALTEQAIAPEAGERKAPFLAMAQQTLREGLQQAPDDPPLHRALAAITAEPVEEFSCAEPAPTQPRPAPVQAVR